MKKLKFGLALALLLGGFAAVGAVVAPSASEVKRVEAATQQSILITNANTYNGQSNSYKDVTATIGGVSFACQMAGESGTIQLRSKNNNSGIVTKTALPGYLRKVVIAWSSKTTTSRTLDIYGSNSPYSAPSALYSSAGTKLGGITLGKTELTVSGNYEYVGMRSNNGALYLDSIELIYEIPETSVTYTTNFDGNGGTVDGVAVKSVETNEGYEVGMPTPVNPGYRFLGWFTAAEGGEKVESLVSSAENDGTTLYAHWEEIVEPSVLTKTVAEVIELPASTEQLYSVTGTVANITNTTYGNFDLVDGDSSIYVYGATTTASSLTFDNNTGHYTFKNPQDFAKAGIEAGDIITLTCFRLDYNTKKELNGVITNIEKPEPTLEEKLAEFTTNASVGFSYTKSGEDYTFSNVRLSFRGTISAELYEEVVAAGVTAAGIECSIEGEEPYTIDCSANIGTDAEGNRYVFGSLLVPEGKENIVVTGKAFVTVDGARLYLASTAHSLVSAVSAYLGDNAPALTAEQLEAVTALAASLGIDA